MQMLNWFIQPGTQRAGKYQLAATTYPLDLISGSTGAWSTRMLRVGDTNPCLKVRRVSDDATKDIGFAAQVLDTDELFDFVGSSNFFVDTWYDRTANGRHVTQATLGNQPQLGAAGIPYLAIGNYPTLLFGGAASLNASVNLSTFITTTAGTVLAIWNVNSGSGTTPSQGRRLWSLNGNNAGYSLETGLNATAFVFDTAFKTAQKTGLSTGTSYVTVWRRNATQLRHHTDATTADQTTTVGTGAALTSPLRIGNNTTGPGWDGYLTELICYDTELSDADLDVIGPSMATPFGNTWT